MDSPNCATKSELLASFQTQCREALATLEKAVAESHENATGEETKSDGKYDTRAIEAAYLAEAQRDQLEKARANLARLEALELEEFGDDRAIAVGALVETESDDGLTFYLLAPAGGGLSTSYLGCPAMLVTPDSRAFQELHGKRVGDQIEALGLEIMGVE